MDKSRNLFIRETLFMGRLDRLTGLGAFLGGFDDADVAARALRRHGQWHTVLQMCGDVQIVKLMASLSRANFSDGGKAVLRQMNLEQLPPAGDRAFGPEDPEFIARRRVDR